MPPGFLGFSVVLLVLGVGVTLVGAACLCYFQPSRGLSPPTLTMATSSIGASSFCESALGAAEGSPARPQAPSSTAYAGSEEAMRASSGISDPFRLASMFEDYDEDSDAEAPTATTPRTSKGLNRPGRSLTLEEEMEAVDPKLAEATIGALGEVMPKADGAAIANPLFDGSGCKSRAGSMMMAENPPKFAIDDATAGDTSEAKGTPVHFVDNPMAALGGKA